MNNDKPRYSRITDVLNLIMLMQKRVSGITLADITKELKVSKRTAERLRDAILDAIPQVNEIQVGGKEKHWGFVSGNMNEIIYFTPEEIAMLENIKEGLLYDDKKKKLESLLDKLKAHSGKNKAKIEDTIELVLRTEGIAVTQKPKYKIDVTILETIRQAIKNKRMIRGKYMGNDKLLAPYGIIYGSGIYLVGVEDGKPNPYVYSLHKMTDVVIALQTFDKGDFDIREYANRSFGIYQNEIMKVELLFSADVAEDVLNYSFHPTQKVNNNEDGTVTVKFKASGVLEILWHIFKWGDKVKIISPISLKKQYVEYLNNVLAVQRK